jgi:hypothetical protein
LQKKQQIIAEIGLEITPDVFEYVQLGNYLLQEWKSDQGGITASFTARTAFDTMSSIFSENLTPVTQTLYTWAVNLFNAAGITKYWVDPALQSITTNSLYKKTDWKSLIQMIAIAGCANVYVTRDNVITIKVNSTRKVRYVRDWLNGSSANYGNHWVEIQAIDGIGTNRALSKVPTSDAGNTVVNPSYATDGDVTNPANHSVISPDGGLKYLQIDLGDVYDIATVNIWHYWGDPRTYHNTKTEVSEDGVNWVTVFDSAISGEYAETSIGRTHSLKTTPEYMTPVDTADYDNMYDEPQITLDKAVKSVGVKYWTDLSTSNEIVSTGNLLPAFDKWSETYGAYPKTLSDNNNTETFFKTTATQFIHDRVILSAKPSTAYDLIVSLNVSGYGGSGGFYVYIRYLNSVGAEIGNTTLPTQTTTGNYVQSFTTIANTDKIDVGFVVTASATGTFKLSYPLLNDPTQTLGDTLKIENNTLINTSSRAVAVSNWIWSQLQYKATYRVNWRGNPAIELNDIMAFENSFGGNMSAYVTRNEISYEGYLSARMQAKGAVN